MYFKIVCLLFLLCFTSHFLGHLMQYPVSSVECQTWLCKQWLHNFIPSWLGFGSPIIKAKEIWFIFSFRLAQIKIIVLLVHSTFYQLPAENPIAVGGFWSIFSIFTQKFSKSMSFSIQSIYWTSASISTFSSTFEK